MANDALRLQVSTVPQAILIEQSTPPEDQTSRQIRITSLCFATSFVTATCVTTALDSWQPVQS